MDAVLKHIETVAIDTAEVAVVCEARRKGLDQAVKAGG